MNLYRIIVLHGAPKDSHESTETYLVANNEEQVFQWISKEKTYGCWSEPDDMRTDDETDEEIPFKDWVMKHKGDISDDEGWEDAYYGVTKWGWSEISATEEEINTLMKLGIAVSVTDSTDQRAS